MFVYSRGRRGRVKASELCASVFMLVSPVYLFGFCLPVPPSVDILEDSA